MEQNDLNGIIAQNLKDLRAQKQLSLGEAADMTGVSKSMLGQIERGESSPTISTLWKIATGLGVSFTSLIEHHEQGTQLVREADMEPLLADEGRFKLYPVIRAAEGRQFEILDLELDAGAYSASRPHAAGTVEFVLVYKGSMDFYLGEGGAQHYTVNEGEVLHYRADQPHVYANPNTAPARAAMVIQYGANSL